ncbi:MAG: acyltransferase [Terriglobales bacterium]
MRRLPSLDGLRAISITLVVAGHWVCVHYGFLLGMSYAVLGVRIFFVISGFLITSLLIREHSATSTINLKDFYMRRAYRIFPAALAFMLPVFVLYWNQLRWYDMAAAALYLANFDPSRPWFLGHLWSLAVEEQFYFAWPGVLKRWYQRRVGILVGVIALVPFYRLTCYALKLPHAATESFPAVADNLAIGCVLAIIAPGVPKIKPWLAALMVLSIVAVPMYPQSTRLHTLVLLFLLWPLLQLSIAGVLLHVVQSPYRVLNLGPVVWLGKISYSLYLWQQLFDYSPRNLPWYEQFLAVGLACLSYYLVEQPMLRLRERRSRRGSTQLANQTASGQVSATYLESPLPDLPRRPML